MLPDGVPGIPVMAAVPVSGRRDFGEGRRPESRDQVQMDEFDGPLACCSRSSRRASSTS